MNIVYHKVSQLCDSQNLGPLMFQHGFIKFMWYMLNSYLKGRRKEVDIILLRLSKFGGKQVKCSKTDNNNALECRMRVLILWRTNFKRILIK